MGYMQIGWAELFQPCSNLLEVFQWICFYVLTSIELEMHWMQWQVGSPYCTNILQGEWCHKLGHIRTNIPSPRPPSGIGSGMDTGKGVGLADVVVGSTHRQLKISGKCDLIRTAVRSRHKCKTPNCMVECSLPYTYRVYVYMQASKHAWLATER